jgi:apolipoprotein N-acyltransferase
MIKCIILVLISSLFYVLAFPQYNFWWLSFVALVPFFAAIENAHGYVRKIMCGFFWSLAISGGLGYWLFPALCGNYGVSLPKTILFFGLCVFIPLLVLVVGFIGCYIFMRRRHIFFYALIVPSLWTTMEYVKELTPVLVPWGAIGYAVIDFVSFSQIADVGGVHGITFFIAAINSLAFILTRHVFYSISEIADSWKFEGRFIRNQRSQMRLLVIMISLFFFLPVLYGKSKIKALSFEIDSKTAQGLAMETQLIQGNYNLVERWSGMGFFHRIQKHLDMTGPPAVEGKKRLIVWPETILNSTTKLDDSFFLGIMSYIGRDALLISGGLKEDEETGGVLNSAYLISGTGDLMRYDKHVLLPYAETSPMIDLLDPYYTAPNQFQPGSSPLSFNTGLGSVGVSICLEILYPCLISQSVRHGAEFLVNISNDAWFGTSPMPYMHLNAARFRAVENRRYLLRASNSGISAIISPDGKILSRSDLFVCEEIAGQFLKFNQVTVYSRFGEIILYLCAGCLFIRLSWITFKN